MATYKTILLTGATDGIGKRTAFKIAKNNVTLLIHGKNMEKGHYIREKIIAETGNKNIFYFNADLSSFKEIDELSSAIHKQFSKIDVLINNAGIYENRKIILENGIEKNFMVNYLAAFTLTLKLLDLLENSGSARIVNVSSMIHANNIDFENLNGEKHYSGEAAYSLTKLCNILFTNELSDKVKKKNISVNSLHPGVINTKLLKKGWGDFGASTDEGSKRILFVACSSNIKNISGKYFMNDLPIRSAGISYEEAVKKKLWDISLKYSNMKFDDQDF